MVLVILAWIIVNARTARLEAGLDQTRGELRIEIDKARSELRTEIIQLRGEAAGLRDMVYRGMVSLHERLAVVESKNS